VRAEAEQCREEHRHAAAPESPRAERHDSNLGDFHPAGNQRFVKAIGERARCTGEQKERSDEQRAGDHRQRPGVHARLLCQSERDENPERALQQVVVERAEKLGDEEGCEPSRRE
jgi:hypothetical protein